MKKLRLLVLALALGAAAIGTSVASADVARYQTQSMTITAVQPEGAISQWVNVWTHTYNVTLNPCDNSFSGTGSMTGTLEGLYPYNETIVGTINGDGTISYTASRADGVVYSLANAPLDSTTVTLATSTPVVPWVLEFKVSKTDGAFSTYRNHGDYVSSQGGGADAAHSCIGMPIN